jgi:hypothetical protein
MEFKSKPLKSYTFKDKRLLVIDWASLSYHQLWSMKTKSSKKQLGSVLPEDDEMIVWRTKMFNRLLDYIRLFNPMDIILCLEGKNAWRKKVVKDYYTKNATIYWDNAGYYVCSDNYAYRVTKAGDGFGVVKVPPKQRSLFESLNHKQLGELPEQTQEMLWGVKTSTGTPVLPSYKGKRGASPWEFSVDKKYWQAYKDEYAMELAPFFRAKAVKCDIAEGDDMIYAAVKKYSGDYDDVIIITRDSDMSQIDIKNVKIYNHTSENFVECAYPQAYLSAKVLSGDTSDNIRGMAYVDAKTGEYKPSKANAVSEKEAVTLMETCPNIYAVAEANGWGEQYMRNRTLIDLSMVPREVSMQIDEIMERPAPELNIDWIKTNEWGIPESKVDYYRTLQQFGFFSVIARENANPESFKGDQLVQKETDMNKKLLDDMASGLDFDDVDGAFGGPSFDFDAL